MSDDAAGTVTPRSTRLLRLAAHIRTQNWTAIGIDFVIVVIGVIVGIQVANWNEMRLERLQEADQLVRIADDLRRDIGTYDEMLTIYAIKQETILALRDQSPARVIAGDLGKAALRLEQSLYKAIPAQHRGTFDELVGSGTFRLLRDAAFRTALAEYYASYGRMSEILAEPLGNYTRLMVGAIPGDVPLENLHDVDQATADRLLAALERVRANPDFEAAANAEAYYARDMYNWLRHFRARSIELLSMLEAQTGKQP